MLISSENCLRAPLTAGAGDASSTSPPPSSAGFDAAAVQLFFELLPQPPGPKSKPSRVVGVEAVGVTLVDVDGVDKIES